MPSSTYASGTPSGSYNSTVSQEQLRSGKAGGYKVDTTRRTGGSKKPKDVTVYNYHAPGYEEGAPSATYGSSRPSRQ